VALDSYTADKMHREVVGKIVQLIGDLCRLSEEMAAEFTSGALPYDWLTVNKGNATDGINLLTSFKEEFETNLKLARIGRFRYASKIEQLEKAAAKLRKKDK
jgi:hypothetical protein